MTTPLLYLRSIQLGLTVRDIDELDMGFLYDMFAEKDNDDIDYPLLPSQDDFDNF